VGTSEVSANIARISQAAGETGQAVVQVRDASNELAQKGEILRGGVTNFLTEVRKVA